MHSNEQPNTRYSIDMDGAPRDVIAFIAGSYGGEMVELGSAQRCRYCGYTAPDRFRNVSHTLPEGLGNKWIVSLDECDECNKKFARYDDALAKSIGPILTLGGTKGKGNIVRQTGRTLGTHIKQTRTIEGKRQLSIRAQTDDLNGHVGFTSDGSLVLKVPLPPERFIPRLAYKGLVKMALAIMPEEELTNFQNILDWISEPEDTLEIPHLHVGLSFGSIGNAPPLSSALLLKRTTHDLGQPYMIFILSVGSVCLQIDLKSDAQDGAWPPQLAVRSGIRWKNVIADDKGENAITLSYGDPQELDWSSKEPSLGPIESFSFKFDPATENGRFTPIFR